MKTVVNTNVEKVETYFDGKNIIFGAGQKKFFEDGIASEIVRENEGLVFEEDVPVAEVAEEAPEAPVEAKGDVYKETTTKKGIVQYRKNGKIISKEEYENR
jgi:hypothetical protein